MSERLSKSKRVEVRAILDAKQHPVPPEYIEALLSTLDFAECYINALHAGWEKADQRNAGIIDGLRRQIGAGRRDGRSHPARSA